VPPTFGRYRPFTASHILYFRIKSEFDVIQAGGTGQATAKALYNLGL
jgi:hypothetical protein